MATPRKYKGRPPADRPRDGRAGSGERGARGPRKAFGPRAHAPGPGGPGRVRYNTHHAKAKNADGAAGLEGDAVPAASPVANERPERGDSKGRERFIARDVRIVFEDADFLVVDKPHGMLSATLPGQRSKDPTLFDLVKRFVNVRAKVKRRAWIIHRLDKETSGLVIFAKSERAFSWLKEELRARRIHRVYVAVVEGEFEQAGSGGEGGGGGASRRQLPMETVQSYLYEDSQGLMRSTQSPTSVGKGRVDEDEGDAGAKLAVTHFRVTESAFGKSLLSLRLETGRKNQIRVHMQEIKHPIVGDRRYGASTDPIERVCLHASELGFTHPASGKEMRFFSQPPVAFLKLMGKKGEEARAEPDRVAAGEEAKPGVTAARDDSASRRSEPAPKKERPAREDVSAGEAGSWEHVADWYDELIEERGSDHHENVIIPNTLRLLGMQAGEKALDVACGQGAFCRRLAGLGVSAIGVDAAPSLISAAQRLSGKSSSGDAGTEFKVGDARDLASLGLAGLDAATCIMALMNINPLQPVLDGIAGSLRVGGRCVVVVLHPAFRSPGQTSWGWDGAQGGGRSGTKEGHSKKRDSGTKFAQFRRVDGYLSPGVRDIVMNPGAVAKGQEPVVTQTFHRSIQAYVKGFVGAGLLVSDLEEWPSARLSEPGPRAAEENRARREIPMFLAIRGVKVS